MRRIILSIIAAALSAAALNAQSVRENWNEIDKVTVYSQFHASSLKTLYLVPVDESAVAYTDDIKQAQRKKFDKNRQMFRDMIRQQISKAYPKLDIRIVESMPATLGEGEAALQMKYTEFDTGSAALRAVTYGADMCAFAVTADVLGQGMTELVGFQHRQQRSGNPFGAYYPHEIHKSFQGDISELLTTMFKELDKE